MTPEEQSALDAYFWKRTRGIIVVLLLVTLYGWWGGSLEDLSQGRLRSGPNGVNKYESVVLHSDKLVGVITGKKELHRWWPPFTRYQVSYEYTIGDDRHQATEQLDDARECYDALTVGQQAYIYYNRDVPEQTFTECHFKMLVNKKPLF